MKQSILSNWNIFRFIRLVMGVAITVQAILMQDIIVGVAGLLITSMAIFNIGCCGTGGCSVSSKKTSQTTKEISYEEVI
jgi:hypothetical protein